MNTIIKYGNYDIDFSKKEKQKIIKNNMAILKGKGVTVKWTFMSILRRKKNFPSKKEAEMFININKIKNCSIVEESCFYIKAVKQNRLDFGLFEKTGLV